MICNSRKDCAAAEDKREVAGGDLRAVVLVVLVAVVQCTSCASAYFHICAVRNSQ